MVTIIMIIDSQLKVLKFTSLFFRSLERADNEQSDSPFVKRIFSLENVETMHVPFRIAWLALNSFATFDAQYDVVMRSRSHSSSVDSS